MTTDIEFRLKNIENNLEKILLLLNDNEKGLVTKVALHQQKIDEIPSPTTLKYWSAVGGGVVTSVGLFLFILYRVIRDVFSGGG